MRRKSKMSKPYVFVTMRIPQDALVMLEEIAEVHMWDEDYPCPREKLLAEVEKADALLSMLTDRIDEELLQIGKKLKLVANMAVGYDNIDVSVANKLGIIVTNTPDVLTEATADLTFALLMATSRRLIEANKFLHEGKWKSWSPMLLAGQDIYGATLGIVGMGRIGQSVARRAQGFQMNVIYHNRKPIKDDVEKIGAAYCDLDTLLQKSDFVVVLTPFTPETKHLFGEEQFKLMKSSAVFINASRGPVVDEDALYTALIKGEIWAAGLDVFEKEPISTDHPLLTLDNVVALPHIGSASISSRTEMVKLAAKNISLVLQGEQPVTKIEP